MISTIWRKSTPEEIQNGANEMTFVNEVEIEVIEDPIAIEKQKYDQRVVDGMNAYLTLMAELRLNSIANNLPREVNREIEEKLEYVKTQVTQGQWISAREKLDDVIVGGYLTQELFDRIKNALDSYISTNY